MEGTDVQKQASLQQEHTDWQKKAFYGHHRLDMIHEQLYYYQTQLKKLLTPHQVTADFGEGFQKNYSSFQNININKIIFYGEKIKELEDRRLADFYGSEILTNKVWVAEDGKDIVAKNID